MGAGISVDPSARRALSRVALWVVAGAIAAPAIAQPTAQADVALGPINNQYICAFERSVPGESVRNEAAKGAGSMGQILHVYRRTIKGFAVRLPAQPGGRSAVAELRANNPKITGCEQDQIVRALVQGKGKPGGGGTAPTQTEPWGITRVGGPGSASSGTAWVIDSVIDLDHPDLKVDTTRDISFVGGTPDDENGHGTHVAGTIAALNNGVGVVGVSPGTTVVSVRVLDRRGSGAWSGVIAGVEHVAQFGQNGDVANMSLGGGFSQMVNDAVEAAATTVKFTIAAGNSSADASNYSPASADGANIYTVSSFAKGVSELDDIDPWSSFSNFGPPVDYAEPGSSILSTYKGGGYQTLSGTSMAAPHLAGILLLGGVQKDGTVDGDRDNVPDPIGVR